MQEEERNSEGENKITLFDLTETSNSMLKTVKNIESTNDTIIVDMIQNAQENVFTKSFTTFNNNKKNNKVFNIDSNETNVLANITLDDDSRKIYFKINDMTYIKLPNNFTINDHSNEISIGKNEGKITLQLQSEYIDGNNKVNKVTLWRPGHQLCFNIQQNNFTEYTCDGFQHFYFDANGEKFIGKRSTYLENLKSGFQIYNKGITTSYAWKGCLKGVMGIDIDGYNGCLCGKGCCSNGEIYDDSLYGGARTLNDVKNIFSLNNITNSNDIKKIT